jgi:hypothetical protein
MLVRLTRSRRLIGWFDRATAVELDFDQFTEADTNGTGAGRPDIGNHGCGFLNSREM